MYEISKNENIKYKGQRNMYCEFQVMVVMFTK